MHSFRHLLRAVNQNCAIRQYGGVKLYPCSQLLIIPHGCSLITRRLLVQSVARQDVGHDGATGADGSATQSTQKTKKRSRGSQTGKSSLRTVAVEAQMTRDSESFATEDTKEREGNRTITALTVADAFDMESVASILKYHQLPIDPDGTGFDDDQLIHTREANGGDIFVFPSGTMVAWSLPSNVASEYAKNIFRPAAVGYSEKKIEMEDMEYIEDIHRDSSTLKGDIIVLGTKKQARQINSRSDITVLLPPTLY